MREGLAPKSLSTGALGGGGALEGGLERTCQGSDTFNLNPEKAVESWRLTLGGPFSAAHRKTQNLPLRPLWLGKGKHARGLWRPFSKSHIHLGTHKSHTGDIPPTPTPRSDRAPLGATGVARASVFVWVNCAYYLCPSPFHTHPPTHVVRRGQLRAIRQLLRWCICTIAD